ncbi:DUF4468 domain-containing protein [Algoriphagus kandeliae]|uniref:DUF4468 domain-containing protein n=1 Tax=Algoriphagus kandeliae TaxID=2562278 RepID=A0A4Y9QLV6_9BACT|nr:DUF4468 domain-containing protein [Algoriphagus kandeliae]TFV93177.1 DUF4468 domain-containing protein [Algoriphagus kandeliae]
MKTSYFTLVFCFIFGFNFAQKARIALDGQEIVTVINAVSETNIFTKSGNIPIEKIKKITFEKFDSKFESTYSKLSEKLEIDFGDGTDFGDISNENFVFSDEKEPSLEDEYVFIKIDSINLSQDELYTKAKSYIAYSFKSAQDVIQLDDKENGRIITKGNFTSDVKVPMGRYPSIIEFTFTIDVRDGKFRGIIEDLTHKGLIGDTSHVGGSFENEKPAIGTFFFPKGHWDKVKEQGKKDAILHLEDFANYMKSKAKIDDF